MNNYIILNGVKSNSITGLLISSLPPITKPAKRVNREEIDGRDGDISTFLGYSAYDKTIEIGLTYNYDVNEIITYFNSSGLVTFSNEPDKYYKYEITDQIDLERLLRFKRASVTFHIQPFKYSTLEKVKSFDLTDSESISITNDGNIYSRPLLTIYGTGNIGIYLNGNQLFQIALGTNESITLDTNNMEAYNGDTLLNRLVTGDYDNFKLEIGNNTITWSGTITRIDIANYSRWI